MTERTTTEENTDTSTEVGTTRNDTDQTTTQAQISGEYTRKFPTAAVNLSLSEVPDGFTLQGETRLDRESATGEQLQNLQKIGAVLRHERAYRSDTQPELIFASVIVFQSPTDGERWLQAHLDRITNNGGSVSTKSVSDDVSARQAKFQSSRELQTVAFYKRRSNVVFYVAVAGDSFASDVSERLFVEMVSDFP